METKARIPPYPSFPLYTAHYWFLEEEEREARVAKDLRLLEDKGDDLKQAIMRTPCAVRYETVKSKFSHGMLKNLVRHLLFWDIVPVHARQMDAFEHDLLVEMVVDRWAPLRKPWQDIRRADLLDEDDEEAIRGHSDERLDYLKATNVPTMYRVLG